MADDKIAAKAGPRKPAFIYALIDPRNGEVRYIGKAEDIRIRLNLHLAEARREDSKGHKSRWLRVLMSEGLRPLIRVLEIVPIEGSWAEAERRHIAEHKARGVRLVNRTNGGEGVPDVARTEEWKQKGVESRRANPKYREAVLKAAERRRGIPLTPEHKANIGAAHKGRKYPPEFGAKISASQKGRPAHPNSTEGSRRARLGIKESEETKAKKRAAMEKHQEAQSERQIKNWEDPEYRKRVTANMMGRSVSEQARQKLATSTAASWGDDAVREKRITGLREVVATPGWRQTRREIANRMWSDPEFRERMMLAQRAGWKNKKS